MKSVFSAQAVRIMMSLYCCTVVALAGPGHDRKEKKELPEMLRSTGAALDKIYDLMDEQKLASAEAKLKALSKKVAEREPDQAYAQRALGYLNLDRENYTLARKHLERALSERLFPNDVYRATTIDLAQLLYLENKPRRVVEILEPLMNDAPVSIQGSRILGAALMELKRYAEAVTYLETASRSSEGSDRELNLTLVSAYSNLQQFGKAAAVLERLLVQYKDDSTIYRLLAQMLYMDGKKNQAAARYYLAYEKGLVKKNDDIMFLIQLQAEANSPVLGIEIVEEGLEKGHLKKNIATYKVLARLNAQAQNHNASAKLYERVYSLKGDDMQSLLQASQLYLYAGNHSAAARTSRELLEIKKLKLSDKQSDKRIQNQAKQVLSQIEQLSEIASLENKHRIAKP